ncbi:MAG: ribonuclease P protein component [Devosia sp.]
MSATPSDARTLRRLTRRTQFLNAARGSRSGRPSLTLQAIAAEAEAPGIGLTITKKVGNAPERNRIRRRLRAAARACGAAFRPQHDYVLIGRREALGIPFEKLVSDLNSAIAKVHASPRANGTPKQ